ncbi:MAG: zf-TFIIB domain-containing protein [Betaproteobacteria bacterium]|nr:zf-TFIIB domain-containing protein [Betaproteobacteria bacterium]
MDTALVISDRQGGEIDFCPQCRDVRLGHGELDQLIARPVTMAPTPTGRAGPPSQPPFADSDHEHGRGSRRSGRRSGGATSRGHRATRCSPHPRRAVSKTETKDELR